MHLLARCTTVRTSWLAALALLGGIAVLSCARRMAPAPRAASAPVRSAPAAPPTRLSAGPRMDHAKHLDKGLECADCHMRTADGEVGTELTPITYAACAECHDEQDAAQAEGQRVKDRFFRPDGAPAWEKAIQGYDAEVRWSHTPHAKLACTDCHGVLAAEPRPVRQPFDMAGCMQCHEQRKAPNTCAACHSTLRDDVAPPSHGQPAVGGAWRYAHGAAAAAGEERCELCHKDAATCDRCHQQTPPRSHTGAWRGAHGPAALRRSERCEMCHTDPQQCVACHVATKPASHEHLWKERHGAAALSFTGRTLAPVSGRCDLCHLDPTFCESCHREEPPRNHTHLFRTRTHGVLAAIDRQKCQTCHDSDFCIRCHEDTPPRSHGPLWASGPNLHCGNCHVPISSTQNCRACHFEEPTHDSAPDQPAWHVPGMNCRLCHTPGGGGGGAPPLRHIDNGTQCEVCHR